MKDLLEKEELEVEEVNMKRFLILLGPPGCGKGSQAQLLENYNWVRISTGDLLRENVYKKTELGKKVQEIMERGELVSNEIVFEIIKNKINSSNSDKFILDGYPRNYNQAKLLSEFIKGIDAILYIVLIELKDEDIIKRNSGRRICQNCQKIYNIYFSPPKEENVCDNCGSELIFRKDDEEEVIKRRLEVYKKESKDLINYYKDNIYKINGELGILDIHREILRLLEGKK